jgi:hypothetical protein
VVDSVAGDTISLDHRMDGSMLQTGLTLKKRFDALRIADVN